jgi:hypothetical protein
VGKTPLTKKLEMAYYLQQVKYICNVRQVNLYDCLCVTFAPSLILAYAKNWN